MTRKLRASVSAYFGSLASLGGHVWSRSA